MERVKDEVKTIEFLSRLLILFLKKESVKEFHLDGGEDFYPGLSIKLKDTYIEVACPLPFLEITINNSHEEVEIELPFEGIEVEAVYRRICSFLSKEVSKCE